MEAKESEMVRFVSDFSIPAWHAFLDDQDASQGGEIIRMLSRPGPMWERKREPRKPLGELKELFRTFVLQQDSYEPNVFIISMNSLGMPKRNSSGTRRFATFVLATLLKKRQDAMRHRCLDAVKVDDILIENATIEMLKAMADLNLYNMGHCVQVVLDTNQKLKNSWLDIVNGRSENIATTFKAILSAVVAQKLAESGINLAVVDEVHNWKGRTNGATDFRMGFAPYVPKKLIMSATPFQLEEREMQQVFENVARPDPHGKTWQTLQALYGTDSNIVDDCISANKDLLSALHDLGQHREADEVLSRLNLPLKLLQAKLMSMAADPMVSEVTVLFCEAALKYRTVIDKLVKLERELVVRHLNLNSRRSFHAGIDFRSMSPVPRPTLYSTPGIKNPEDQLVNYLAMRLDQRLRRDGCSAKAKAHLLGGMTSSMAAFRASLQAPLSDSNTTNSPETRRYAAMVHEVLRQHRHPKVNATVAHALDNYRNGRKTLIFCERVATVDELADQIVKGIEETQAQVLGREVQGRGDVRDRESFVDLPFGRLSWSLQVSAAGPDVTDALHNNVVSFVTESLEASGLEPTRRRMLRLFNLYMLSIRPSDEGQALPKLCAHLVTLFMGKPIFDELSKAFLTGERGASFRGDLRARVIAFVNEQFSGAPNLWIGTNQTDGSEFRSDILRILESEAGLAHAADPQGTQPKVAIGFAKTLLDLEGGLKSVLLRPDLMRRIAAMDGELESLVHGQVRAPLAKDEDESAWSKMTRFVSRLAGANGSINVDDQRSTDRKSLWRAISLHGVRTADGGSEPLVQKLKGATAAQARVAVCAAFNSPLTPYILICTSIGSEGIDLHRECAEIIHHDMPWNPARLEQRNGRIDRVGSLSKAKNKPVRIGVPFLEQNYERFQFDRLLTRAQLFKTLLGRLDFDVTDVDQDNDDDPMPELDCDDAANMSSSMPLLPEALAQWLSVDLSVWPTSDRPASI